MFSFFLNNCLTNFCCLRYVLAGSAKQTADWAIDSRIRTSDGAQTKLSAWCMATIIRSNGSNYICCALSIFISGLPQISQLSLSFEGCHLPSPNNSAYCMASARILFANLRQLCWCVHHRDNRRKRLFITTTVGHSLWPSKDASFTIACHSWVD
jgi:hypothetical protein